MRAFVNGTDLYYEIEGEGLPCIVLHGGLGFDHTYLKPWFSPLADDLKLVYYDHRGNGRSARMRPSYYTHENFVDDVEAMRRYLGFDTMILIGHSYGSFISLMYALKYQQSISHLILVGCSPSNNYYKIGRTYVERETPELLPAFDAYEAGLAKTDSEFEDAVAKTAHLYFHDQSWVKKLEQIPNKRAIYSAVVQNIAIKNEMPKYDVRPHLSEIKVPTLIIAGRHDWIVPPSEGEIIKNGIPNAKLVIFENSAHMIFVEENKKFVNVVKTFLKENLFGYPNSTVNLTE